MSSTMKGLVLLLGVLLLAVTCDSLQVEAHRKQGPFPLKRVKGIEGHGQPRMGGQRVDAAAFDLYLMVQQWDPSLSTSYFTIHGLWPEFVNGSYPQNCAGPKFDVNVISGLVSTLNKVWPSNSGSNNVFWQHEWEKHGTCSDFAEYAYFQNAINLQAKYNVKDALDKSNILPTGTKTYTTASINSAVQTYIGAQPALHCTGSKLVEIALCISKSLGLTNCPTTLGSYFKCPSAVSYS